jgi:hypothetical protein
MLQRARANAAQLGFAQVEFREGRLEKLPVVDASIDAVTSNCVINLVPDKAAVFTGGACLEAERAIGDLDIILDGALPAYHVYDVYPTWHLLSDAAPAYFVAPRPPGAPGATSRSLEVRLRGASSCRAEEVRELLARTGVSQDQVRGKVRSITVGASQARTGRDLPWLPTRCGDERAHPLVAAAGSRVARRLRSGAGPVCGPPSSLQTGPENVWVKVIRAHSARHEKLPVF